ncbi:MAG: hypothetical protein ACJ741_05265 [Pyrinomonadaceae bacterium]
MKMLLRLAVVALSCAPCLAQTGPVASGKGDEVSRQAPRAPEIMPCTDKRIQAFFDSVTSRLRPEAAAKFRELSKSDAVRGRALPSAPRREAIGRARQAVRPDFAVLGGLTDGDIEALVFLVLTQAAKSAQEDLKAIMDGVKDIDKEKDAIRQTREELKREICEFIYEREGRPKKNGQR